LELTWKVGDGEHHPVSLHYSRLRNTVRIAVDGATVKRDKFWVWIPARRHYELEIGTVERHHVSLDLAFPRFAAKFKNPTVELRVDGTPIMTTPSQQTSEGV
jgi:hypothetical protein